MKIEKYKKLNKGKYKISFDRGNEIILYEDVILKYSLLLKKEIDLNLLDEILKENEFYEVYSLSLSYIEYKLRSKKELVSYLTKKEFKTEIIERVIEKLVSIGLLNDETYIKAFINDKINFTNYGPYKIKKMLLDSELDEELIDKFLRNIDEDVMISRIKKIIEKRKKISTKLSTKMFIQKTTEYLLMLGYEKETFYEYFESADETDSSNIIKERDLLYKKLSKKYEGNKLAYEIKNKLYKKGYSFDLINRIMEE
jgi:regulatory protein